jgi:hypothetical protein
VLFKQTQLLQATWNQIFCNICDDDVNSNKMVLLIKEECLDLDDDDVVMMSFALVVLVLMWVRCFWYQC